MEKKKMDISVFNDFSGPINLLSGERALTLAALEGRLKEVEVALETVSSEADYDRLFQERVDLGKKIPFARIQQANANLVHLEQLRERHEVARSALLEEIAELQTNLPGFDEAIFQHLVGFYQALENGMSAQIKLAEKVTEYNRLAETDACPGLPAFCWSFFGWSAGPIKSVLGVLRQPIFGSYLREFLRRMDYLQGLQLQGQVKSWKLFPITLEVFSHFWKTGLWEVHPSPDGSVTLPNRS
jgi:hypothetical protein